MTPLFIWAIALSLYALFWLWYVGLRRKITSEEVQTARKLLQERTNCSEKQIQDFIHFFKNDDGNDFVMVNLLELLEPKAESRKKLARYQKIFMGNLLKRAGHPITVAFAASGNIENIDCDKDNWTAAAMIRYRSRRDFLEILPETLGSEHHKLKLASLARTCAFPSAPWSTFGGPKLVVPLILALLAAFAHLAS